MKFVCAQHDLNVNLALVSRAVSTRPTHPVLANIKIEAITPQGGEREGVRLTGFDLSLGIQTSFEAQVEEEGVLTLPAKLLTDIIAKLPSGEISIDDDAGENLVTIASASGRYRVRGMSAEEFPELPSIEGEADTLPAHAFIDGIKGASIACSQDETKQILTGIYLKAEPERLEFAATDGHRLGIVEVYPDEVAETNAEDEEAAVASNIGSFEVTVPARALRELEKMLGSGQDDDRLGLQLEQGQVVFGLGDRKLTTRTIDGKYPEYRLLLPKQFQRQITLDRKQLLAALERTSILADQGNLVKFSISSTNSTVELSVESQERGSGRESLDAQISGEDLDIAFNIKYLMDGIKTLSTQEITINLNGALEPVILTPLGGVKMTYLVMPVQIRS